MPRMDKGLVLTLLAGLAVSSAIISTARRVCQTEGGTRMLLILLLIFGMPLLSLALVFILLGISSADTP